jgi:hypothetical protein
LLDQGVPKGLASFLASYEVRTAYQLGWATLTNGKLLAAAEQAGFTHFITADQNMRYQQNLEASTLAVIVLGTNIWPVIAADPSGVLAAVRRALPGKACFVEYPKPVRPARSP